MPRCFLALAFSVGVWPGALAAQTIIGPGDHPELTIGADGLGLVAYLNAGLLEVAHCSDPACSVFTVGTLGAADTVGGVVTDPGGRAVILYAWAGDVRVVRCGDASCSRGAFSTVTAGTPTGITIGGDGLPLIALLAAGVPTVAHCDDAPCSSATLTAYPQPQTTTIGRIITGANGLGLSVLATGSHKIDILRCLDAACLSASVTLLEESPQYPIGPTHGLVLGGDGDPLLDHYFDGCFSQGCNRFYGVAHCADPDCSSLDGGSQLAVVTESDPYWNDSLDVGGDGLGTVVYGTSMYGAWLTPQLALRRCTSADCSSVTSPVVLDNGSMTWCSLRTGADGYPLVAYVRAGEVRVVRANVPTGAADLAVTKTDGAATAVPGGRLTYTLVASNAGPSAVAGAPLSDVLPPELVDGAWSCSPSPGATCNPAAGVGDIASALTLPVGGSATFTLSVTVDGAATGQVSNTASISPPNEFIIDPQPANNVATDVDAVVGGPVSLSLGDVVVGEGNGGLTPAAFPVTLSRPSAQSVSVGWATVAGGTATAGADYVPASGTFVFAPGQTAGLVTVSVIGDTAVELDETFLVDLSGPSGALIVDGQATGTITDDDAPSLSSDELVHGSSESGDLRAQGPVPDRDYFRLAQAARSSWEVAVDAASGDVAPLILERLGADNVGVLQTGAMSPTGGSASLRWENRLPGAVTNQHLVVRSGGCTTTCDASAVYRIRAWETTASVARFNNSSTQVTFLILSNPGAKSVSGTVWYWSVAGGLLASELFNLAPRATLVRNTSLVPGASAVSGSIMVTHNGSYGVLSGKAVAVEPATGFAFDTPLTVRPR